MRGGELITMNINWKLRLQSYPFWVAIFGLIGIFLTKVLGIEVPEYQSTVDAVLMLMLSVGIVSDPTTAGFSDSKTALEYVEPKKD